MEEQLVGGVIFSVMLIFSLLLGHWLHLTRFKWATEGSVALLVGLLAGGLFVAFFELRKQSVPGHLLKFESNVFLNVLIPPIIFNAGMSIKKKLFFANFVTLALFGIVGTFASTAFIGAGSLFTLRALNLVQGQSILVGLALGAIFSSTDSVATLQVLNQDTHPMLFSLVFGEGVCNDATAIVLLGAVSKIQYADQLTIASVGNILVNFSYLFMCSLALGIVVGLLSALIINKMFKVHSTDREVLLVGLMGFMAYALAQICNLSGIFAVFFCGITMSHYTWHSLSPSAKVLTIYIFRILSFLAEVFLFLYSGFDMWNTTLWHEGRRTQHGAVGKVVMLTLSLLIQVLVSRAAFVSLLCLLANCWRTVRISLRDAIVIWWAGVMRGAITIALTYHFFYESTKQSEMPKAERQIIVAAATGVILITTVGFGALTKPFAGWVLHEPADPTLFHTHVSSEFFSHPLLTAVSSAPPREEARSWLHHVWRMYDSRLLQPLFGGRKRGIHHQEPHSPGGPLNRLVSEGKRRMSEQHTAYTTQPHTSAGALTPPGSGQQGAGAAVSQPSSSQPKDGWDAYVAENWLPALQLAYGPQWREQFGGEHLLYAGCDASKWLPVDYRTLQHAQAVGATSRASQDEASSVVWLEDASQPGHAIPPVSLQYCSALHLAAFYGHAAVVEVLLQAGNCDARAGNLQGCTPLHLAAHQGHTDVVARLCRTPSCEIDAADKQGRTALHHAAALGQDGAVMELWARGCNIEPADLEGWTALHHAAEAGHVGVVSKLVIAGSHVQRYEAHGLTAGHLAARHGFPQVLEKLLLAGYAVDTLGGVNAMHGSGGSTALHLAAQNGHYEMVEKLLAAGADPKKLDYRGCSALQCAAEGGHASVFNRLLEAGCDPEAKDNMGATVLHAAAQGGNWQIIDTLLNLGANPGAKTKYGRNVLHYAAYGGTHMVVDRLVEMGCDLNAQDDEGNSPWHAGAEGGSVAVVQRMLDSGCDVHAANNIGCTALHYAARAGCLDIVELLLEKGADLRAVCEEGETALHYAAEMGHKDVVGRLLRDADLELVNMRDDGQWSALHYAAEQLNVDVVHLLIKAGADVTTQTVEGWSALHLAAKEQCTAAVRALLAAGCDASLKDVEGCTALHYAVQLSDMDLFNALYTQPGESVNDPDSKGYTVLHYAVDGGSPDIVGILLFTGHGVDVEGAPNTFSPLHLAAKKGHIELMPFLLKAGYKADALAPDGRSPLHYAALDSTASWAMPTLLPVLRRSLVNHAAVANVLIEAGANAHAVDESGCTALHYGAGSGDLAIMQQLMSLGVDIQLRDASGWTPLVWASSGGHSGVLTKLLVAGADITVVDRTGRTALHWAAEKGHVEAVSVLVAAMAEANMDLHALDSEGLSAAQLGAVKGFVDVVAKVLDRSRTKDEKNLTALHLAIQNGLDSLVRSLLALPSCDINARDTDGLAALHWAASTGASGILSQLVGAGCDVDAPTNDGWTALHEAANNGHVDVVRQLLNAASQVNAKTSNGSTALHNAAANGHAQIAQLLLDAGADCDIQALSGTTALYNAATGGHLEVANMLIKADAELDLHTTTGSTALHTAASNGHTAVVEKLVEAGCDMDVQAQNGSTALHNAAANGHAAVAEVLTATGCDCDIQNSNGNTALHVASSKGHLEVVEVLLKAGADPHIKNSKTWCAVHSAAGCGHFEVVLRLVQHGAVWRNRLDCDVIKMVCRKSSYKPSYVEGRLRLAEKERQRFRNKGGAAGSAASLRNGPSHEELEQLEALANANMAALLQEEAAQKESQEKKRSKKKKAKKKKGRKGSSQAGEDEDAAEDGSGEVSAADGEDRDSLCRADSPDQNAGAEAAADGEAAAAVEATEQAEAEMEPVPVAGSGQKAGKSDGLSEPVAALRHASSNGDVDPASLPGSPRGSSPWRGNRPRQRAEPPSSEQPANTRSYLQQAPSPSKQMPQQQQQHKGSADPSQRSSSYPGSASGMQPLGFDRRSAAQPSPYGSSDGKMGVQHGPPQSPGRQERSNVLQPAGAALHPNSLPTQQQLRSQPPKADVPPATESVSGFVTGTGLSANAAPWQPNAVQGAATAGAPVSTLPRPTEMVDWSFQAMAHTASGGLPNGPITGSLGSLAPLHNGIGHLHAGASRLGLQPRPVQQGRSHSLDDSLGGMGGLGDSMSRSIAATRQRLGHNDATAGRGHQAPSGT
ncbi:hypothetical protein WJX72_002378 [[Myrmecia] bisecta]|uniref:Cation/H+ exchanger transmembrane domain-containing protein n=1 Tax=[Myrmecia] bisecta TaxID=41462 RepID=A0AAW1R6B2_9CHLO